MAKIRGIPVSCLGPGALAQVRQQGYDVDKLLARERGGSRGKSKGVNVAASFLSRDNKFGVSAKDQRTLDGIVFDSKLEMNAYRFLKERGITFTRQVEFIIQEKFQHEGRCIRPIKYLADFCIEQSDGGRLIVDTKGMITPDCKLKLKLLLAQGVVVHCVGSLTELAKLLVEQNIAL